MLHTNIFQPGIFYRALFITPHYLHFKGRRIPVQADTRGFKKFYSLNEPAFTVHPSGNDREEYDYLYDFRSGKAVLLYRSTIKEYLNQISPREDAALVKYLNTLLGS